jgi:hypothetical protein
MLTRSSVTHASKVLAGLARPTPAAVATLQLVFHAIWGQMPCPHAVAEVIEERREERRSAATRRVRGRAQVQALEQMPG